MLRCVWAYLLSNLALVWSYRRSKLKCPIKNNLSFAFFLYFSFFNILWPNDFADLKESPQIKFSAKVGRGLKNIGKHWLNMFWREQYKLPQVLSNKSDFWITCWRKFERMKQQLKLFNEFYVIKSTKTIVLLRRSTLIIIVTHFLRWYSTLYQTSQSKLVCTEIL